MILALFRPFHLVAQLHHRNRPGPSPCRRLLFALLLSVAGVFLSEYVISNVPGNPTVDFVQGRFFLPIALGGVIFVSGFANRRWQPLLYVTLVMMLMAFPIVTIAVVTRALVLRYYLG